MQPCLHSAPPFSIRLLFHPSAAPISIKICAYKIISCFTSSVLYAQAFAHALAYNQIVARHNIVQNTQNKWYYIHVNDYDRKPIPYRCTLLSDECITSAFVDGFVQMSCVCVCVYVCVSCFIASLSLYLASCVGSCFVFLFLLLVKLPFVQRVSLLCICNALLVEQMTVDGWNNNCMHILSRWFI